MSFTWFMPFFCIFVLYALRGRHQWLAATIVASFLQGASPILLVAVGRVSGIQPAYALIPIGLYHYANYLFSRKTDHSSSRLSTQHLLMFFLTLLGVAGAVLLPRFFEGEIYVMPPSAGYSLESLRPTVGNYIQAFYWGCNFILFSLVAWVTTEKETDILYGRILAAFEIGCWLSVSLGIYQILAPLLSLPWPAAIINSNLGVLQHYSQMAFGITRMSATFLEPSMMAMHYIGMFALFGLILRRWGTALLVLICLLISTSTTAIAGILMTVPMWMIFDRRNHKPGTIGAISILIATLAGAIAIASLMGSDSNSLALVNEKLSSDSGFYRSSADRAAIATFIDSWGLGVGVGSTRASSFITTFAACMGIPGLLLLVAFFGSIFFESRKSTSIEVQGFGLTSMALLVGWLVSVPDLAMPMVWISSALASQLPHVQRKPFEPAGGKKHEYAYE